MEGYESRIKKLIDEPLINPGSKFYIIKIYINIKCTATKISD